MAHQAKMMNVRNAGMVLERRSPFMLMWKTFLKDKAATVSLAFIGLIILLAAFAPLLTSYDPTQGVIADRLSPPGEKGHLLGTDGQGRDILSRLLYGARITLVVSIIPVIVAGIVSLFLGLLAGYFRGNFISEAIMRGMDILFAFPMVLFAIAIAAVLGPGTLNVMLAVGITLIPYMTRVVYTSTVQESSLEYIEASRAAGSSTAQILISQLTPNVLSPLLVYGTTIVGLMVVLSSGLSFLGIGIQPPTPDWGIMTADGRSVLLQGSPHVTIIPGTAILLVSLAFNLLGDGLRDALDPRKQTML